MVQVSQQMTSRVLIIITYATCFRVFLILTIGTQIQTVQTQRFLQAQAVVQLQSNFS